MGLFSKLKQASAAMSGLGSGALGEITVPGEGKVELPAGKVRITYRQQPIELRGWDEWKWKKPEIDIRVTAPGGDEILVERPSGVTVAQDPGGPRRSDFGALEVPATGTYSIRTNPLDDWYGADGLEPSLLFDAEASE